MKTEPRAIVYTGVLRPKPDRHVRGPWLVGLFVLVGIAACIGIDVIAERSGALALLVAAMAPPGLALLAFMASKVLSWKRAATVQWTWWHFLWLLMFASALVFRRRDVSQIDANPLDAWALYRVGLEVMVGLVLLAKLALRRPAWLGATFRGFIGILGCFAMVCLVSTAWSVVPAWTLYKSLEYLLGLALIAAIVETATRVESYASLFNWTWVLYGLLTASAWLSVLFWPRAALHPGHNMKIGLLGVRLTGVVPRQSSDGPGLYAAMLGLIALARLLPISGSRRRTGWYLLLLVSCVITMVYSQTRMAIAGFLLGAFLLLYFSKRLRPRTILALAAPTVVLLATFGVTVWTYLRRGENTQELSSLSSRVIWWSYAWHKFLERPLTGFGAYAGRFVVMARIGQSATASLHSDILETIVGTGIWGLIPFLAAVLGLWWFLVRYLRLPSPDGPQRQLVYEAIAVFAVLTLNSPLLPMLTWQAPLYFLVIVAYAEYLRRHYAPVYAPGRHPARFQYSEAIPHDPSS